MAIKVTHQNAEDPVVEVIEELVELFTFVYGGEHLLTGLHGDSEVTEDVRGILGKAGFELEVS